MRKKVKIKQLSRQFVMPKMADDGSVGYDLYACITRPIAIAPHKTAKIGVGFALEPPRGYFAAIFPRSGLSTKEGLRLANSVGIVDPSYRNEIAVVLYNDSDEVRKIEPNERIAQIVFLRYGRFECHLVSSLSKTERGMGGFGHSGKF